MVEQECLDVLIKILIISIMRFIQISCKEIWMIAKQSRL